MWRRQTLTAAARLSGMPGLPAIPAMPMETTERAPVRMTCGELRPHHVGSLVELAGSVQHQRLNRFLLLRDAHGTTQLVLPDNRPDIAKRLLKLPLRSFISVIGRVTQRPPAAVNEVLSDRLTLFRTRLSCPPSHGPLSSFQSMNTGRVEVSVQDLVMVRVNRGPQSKNGPDGVRHMSSRSGSTSLTSEEYLKCGNSEGLIQKFKNRSDTCSSLSVDEVERPIRLIGWLHGQHLPRFIKIKDGYGAVQCLLPSDKLELQEAMKKVSANDILEIDGKIVPRPQSHINSLEENGEIEILVNSIEIINPSLPPSSVKIEKERIPIENSNNNVNTYTCRTHTCGELRVDNVGDRVTLCGWLQFCRMGRFLLLRDSYGVTQCLISEEDNQKWNVDKIPLESVIEIQGLVGKRPPPSVNMELATGEVEVMVNSLKLLNPATFLPFSMRAFNKPKEDLRLQHRYLYLRYPEMQQNLRIRSDMIMKMRKFLIELKNFIEVETPALFCRTPGGAKEFVVPTRHKGKFYSLIQSPQQHKQMLMAGGIDRYFQVARCFRDETTRGDRQPEFTQLDIEMSFAGQNDVLALIEDLFRSFWPHSLSYEPFIRLTYNQALSTYGTDKPDISYEFKLQDVTDVISLKQDLINNIDDFGAFSLVVKKSEFQITNSFRKKLRSLSSKYSNIKLMAINVEAPIEKWSNSIEILGNDIMFKLASKLMVEEGDHFFLAYGEKENCCWCLGDIRTKIASEAEASGQLIRSEKHNTPLWIVDFPLFVKATDGALEACHHPFTSVHPEDIGKLQSESLKVRSLAYDLVLKGNEVGGGSVRVHDSKLQLTLLEMLKISPEPMHHFIHALECGCPPHAGIALGIDRLVALACNAETIRDVIAFPKSHEGCDPMTGAPSALTLEEQELYHIRVPDSDGSSLKRLHSDL